MFTYTVIKRNILCYVILKLKTYIYPFFKKIPISIYHGQKDMTYNCALNICCTSVLGIYPWSTNRWYCRGCPLFMMTSWNGTLSALLAICAGNSPLTGEFLSKRPVTPSFDDFFDLRLNERLSKQSWARWFATPSRPLWRQSIGAYHT